MRELFDPVAKGLAGVLIDLGLDAVEPKSIVGGATDRSHGDIAIPFHKFAGVLRRPPAESQRKQLENYPHIWIKSHM